MPSGRVWLLTGTPMPNGRPIELVNLLRTIRHPLASCPLAEDSFKDQFCRPRSPFRPFEEGAGHIEHLAARLRDGPYLRRTYADVPGEVPDIIEHIVPLAKVPQPDPKDWLPESAHPIAPEAIESALLEEAGRRLGVSRYNVEKELPGFELLSAYSRACGLAKINSAKNWLLSKVYDWPTDQSVVIFAKHIVVANAMAQALNDNHNPAKVLTGESTAKERAKTCAEFIRGDFRFLVATIGSMGTGVDGLQKASRICVFIEESYSPGDNAQARARLARKGTAFTDPVLCYVLDAQNLLEKKIRELLVEKSNNIKGLSSTTSEERNVTLRKNKVWLETPETWKDQQKTRVFIPEPHHTFTLKHYQQEGVQFLCNNKGAMLCDDPGLGKTAQTITAMKTILFPSANVLIVAPLAVLPSWKKELALWAPGWLCRIVRRKETVGLNPGVVITPWTDLQELDPQLSAVHWDLCVFDEAHRMKGLAKWSEIAESIAWMKKCSSAS